MTTELFYRIRDDWGLDPINTREGENKVSGEDADLTYFLPSGEANLYHHEHSTGDFIVEIPSTQPEHPDNMYLSGSDEDFEKLDSKFMQEIEEQSSSEYYKKIC